MNQGLNESILKDQKATSTSLWTLDYFFLIVQEDDFVSCRAQWSYFSSFYPPVLFLHFMFLLSSTMDPWAQKKRVDSFKCSAKNNNLSHPSPLARMNIPLELLVIYSHPSQFTLSPIFNGMTNLINSFTENSRPCSNQNSRAVHSKSTFLLSSSLPLICGPAWTLTFSCTLLFYFRLCPFFIHSMRVEAKGKESIALNIKTKHTPSSFGCPSGPLAHSLTCAARRGASVAKMDFLIHVPWILFLWMLFGEPLMAFVVKTGLAIKYVLCKGHRTENTSLPSFSLLLLHQANERNEAPFGRRTEEGYTAIYARVHCIHWGWEWSFLKALDRLTLLEENACRKEPHLLVIGGRVTSFSGQSGFLK